MPTLYDLAVKDVTYFDLLPAEKNKIIALCQETYCKDTYMTSTIGEG